MFIGVIAFQKPGSCGSAVSIGGSDAFSEPVTLFWYGISDVQHGEEIEHQHMVGHCGFPKCMGECAPGRSELLAEPADVFPDGFAAQPSVADLKRNARNLIPFWVVGAEVASGFYEQGFHVACLDQI